MIKQTAGLLLVAFLLILLSGCPYGGYKYEEGRFPVNPVNFDAVNSQFDDYNSTAPFIEGYRYLYFSSNRNSSGGNFDVVGKDLRIYFDKENGKLTIDNQPLDWQNHDYSDSLFAMINTLSDEFGPYSLPFHEYFVNDYRYTDLIIYSNDETGNQDLKFAYFQGWGENPSPAEGNFFGPDEIKFLNTSADDAYLTFYGPGFIMYDYYNSYINSISELIFCSDRNGNFDIYRSDKPAGLPLIEFLSDNTGGTVYPVNILNSGSNDKCPYVNGELLVFASDRPGGYGGFDLYFSRRNGDTWSEPLNYGDRINTEYDEYRPVIISQHEFVNELMIFSSNRPGGKGGFDLYYVGIPKNNNF
jgi:hypothetical protein